MLSNNQVHIVSNNKLAQSTTSSSLINSANVATTSLSKQNFFNAGSVINTNTASSNKIHHNHALYSSEPFQEKEKSSQQKNTTNPMQIQNYITWINSHLKKRPGVKLVEDLQSDLTNGVCLIHLIEVISGHVLKDVNLNPKTIIDSKDNIEKILKFMHQSQIKMHQTTSKEIIEGNIKSIMRLVLALAAHFKPTNVQPYTAAIMANKTNQVNSITSSPKAAATTCSSSNIQNRYNLAINKRSLSSNQIGSQSNSNNCQNNRNQNNYANLHINSNNNVNKNNTYVIDSNKNQNYANLSPKTSAYINSKPCSNINNTRNLDSMTHLVQAACVSLADVRRYKNENFNVKYVKRNNLASPTLNKNNFIDNQTFNINKILSSPTPSTVSSIENENNRNTNFSILNSFMSPRHQNAQPLASSTILLPNTTETKPSLAKKDSTFVLNKMEAPTEEKNETENPVTENFKKNHNTFVIAKEVENNKTNYDKDTPNEEDDVEEKNSKNSISTSSTLKSQHIITNLVNSSNEDNEIMLEDVQSLKNMLLNLQSLLMNEQNRDDTKNENEENANTSNNGEEIEDVPLASLTPEEQIAIFRSKIQQLEILNSDLRNELNQIQGETMHKNGIQSGLKTRLTEQDNTIFELKNEQLNLHIINQQLVKEKEDFNLKLNERILQITQLKQELTKKDEAIDNLKLEIKNLMHEKEQNKLVRQQVKQVSETLDLVQEKENALSEMIANADRKLIKIDNKITFNMNKDKIKYGNNHQQALLKDQLISKDEENVLKESLVKLRQLFSSNHSSQYLINTLEQAFLTIIDRLTHAQASSLTLSNSVNTNNINFTPIITNSTSSSSVSSLTSSSANSPVNIQTHQLHSSLSSSINSSSSTSSSSSSSSSISTISLSNKPSSNQQQQINSSSNLNQLQQRNLNINDLNNENNVELPIINNESNVKKIISRLLSHNLNNNNTNNGVNNILPLNENNLNCTEVPRLNIKPTCQLFAPQSQISKNSNSSINTLLTISSTLSNVPSASSTGNNDINQVESIQSSTKCLYYLDNKINSPPFLVTIPKNVGSVTLNDFKEYVKLKSSSMYKFHFKTHDPEFGIVKEEISSEHRLLPLFENRIVAWVQKIE